MLTLGAPVSTAGLTLGELARSCRVPAASSGGGNGPVAPRPADEPFLLPLAQPASCRRMATSEIGIVAVAPRPRRATEWRGWSTRDATDAAYLATS